MIYEGSLLFYISVIYNLKVSTENHGKAIFRQIVFFVSSLVMFCQSKRIFKLKKAIFIQT
jgi:hypothetical protein